MSDTILYRTDGPIARITLNHPQRHNSLGREQLDALEAAVGRIEADEQVRVVVLTGEGEKTFCAGASLGELSGGAIADDAFQRATARLAGLAVPTLCAMNGNVFGGGAELAASCDFRIGIEGMRMRVPAAALGLCYPVEGIRRFVECLGPQATRRILVGSEEFDALTLQEIGFLDQVVSRADLPLVTQALAEHIAGLAPLAVQSMKRILRQMVWTGVDESEAADLVRQCLESSDLQEGFAAQREKRPAAFRGC